MGFTDCSSNVNNKTDVTNTDSLTNDSDIKYTGDKCIDSTAINFFLVEIENLKNQLTTDQNKNLRDELWEFITSKISDKFCPTGIKFVDGMYTKIYIPYSDQWSEERTFGNVRDSINYVCSNFVLKNLITLTAPVTVSHHVMGVQYIITPLFVEKNDCVIRVEFKHEIENTKELYEMFKGYMAKYNESQRFIRLEMENSQLKEEMASLKKKLETFISNNEKSESSS